MSSLSPPSFAGVPTRQELYGQQHLGRYYHGPGEGQVVPPIADVDDKNFVYGPKNEPRPTVRVSSLRSLFLVLPQNAS